MRLQNYNKFILALLAAAGVIASSHLLSGNVEEWVNVCIAAVSAALVYWVPNIPKQPKPTGLTPVTDAHQPLGELPRPSLADDQPGPAEDDDTGTPVK